MCVAMFVLVVALAQLKVKLNDTRMRTAITDHWIFPPAGITWRFLTAAWSARLPQVCIRATDGIGVGDCPCVRDYLNPPTDPPVLDHQWLVNSSQ
jgi:hypothetical protein